MERARIRQNVDRMVGEVNKIIYNMLISGKGVFLPGVGTLYIERQGARKIAKNKLLSPRNVVGFTSQEQAPSLVDEIVNIAGCSQEQAQDIYERWLQKTREGEVLTIEGIGVLNRKSFAIESAFASAINPKGVKTLIVRRRSNAWLYVLCAICVAVTLGVFAYIMWGDKVLGPITFKVKSVEQEVAPSQSSAPIVVDSVGCVVVDASDDMVAEAPATTSAESVTDSGGGFNYYVVMGVFSNEHNATRAVGQAQAKLPNAVCAILPFKGDKYMVTVYGSNSYQACEDFANSGREIYRDLWIYNKR